LPEHLVVTSVQSGLRLDHFLVRKFSGLSRAALGRLILSGNIRVNDCLVKAGYRLKKNDSIAVSFPRPESTSLLAQPIDFGVLYEDNDLLVIDKPAGLIVHPGDGHRQGTLANGLLHRYRSLPGVNRLRPGIVHRLDKDTSGIMLVAKTENALKCLGEIFQNRQISNTYNAILLRHPGQESGRIVAPIGRHPINRKKMAIRWHNGRYAATRWKILQKWPGFCFAEVGIETGRTHQIRVHMASVSAPVAGDRLYGGRVQSGVDLPITRQLLHASTLCFHHPVSGEKLRFTAPLPEDMQRVLSLLTDRFS